MEKGSVSFKLDAQSRIKLVNKRRIDEANYIIANNCSTRECAKFFNVSQSTIVLDMKALATIDMDLFLRVKDVFDGTQNYYKRAEILKKKV